MLRPGELDFRTYRTTTSDVGPGITLESSYGCSGPTHAGPVHAVWTNWAEWNGSEVTFAETIGVEDLGPCDGSCRPGLDGDYKGGFIHEPASPAAAD